MRAICRISLVILAVAVCLAAAPALGGIRVERDIQYFEDPEVEWEYQILDVFVPEGRGPWPVLIFIHGGGWRIGDKDQFPHYNIGRTFAERGVLCVSINYRLTPPGRFPDHARDVARAVAWAKGHVAEYGGDPDNIFISGHSAGAHLAALVALDPQYLAEQGLTPEVFRGVIGLSGPYDIQRLMTLPRLSGLLTHKNLAEVFGEDPELWKSASPMNHATPVHPPIMIVVGSRDRLTPEEVSRRFYEALEAARQDPTPKTEMIVVPGLGHLGLLLSIAKDGNKTADRIEDFIRLHAQER